MFLNRVLPLPPALSTTSAASPLNSGRDSLLPNRIMTSRGPSPTSTKNKSPTASLKSSSPAGRNSPQSPGRQPLEHYQDPSVRVSPSRRSTPKHSSSHISVEAVRRSGRKLPSLSTSSGSIRSTDSPSQLCLCQPEPKVPRPRNAFILYRQHHQAAIVAQNPGLANPEISKIIGDHWRSSPTEVKVHWKGLADEEKLRHQRQYPDYRYQPRRSGRNSVTNSLHSNHSENSRCTKCGGKSISFSAMAAPGLSTPSTPDSPYTDPVPSSVSGASRFLRQIGSSPQVPSPAGFRSSRPSTTNIAGPLHVTTTHNLRHEELEPPLSPDTKRRRFGNGNYAPIRAGSGPLTPFPFPGRRESLPRPEFLHKQQFSMAPPTRPHPHNASLHDNTLTLPPLKTPSISEASSTQAKSVEAMMMSIPHINKIKVLAKISPPLAPPGPAFPQHATRGAIVAIDGQDSESVNAVVRYLSDFLSKEEEYKARVWRTPGLTLPASSETSFANYLQLITHWHSIAQEVVKHITTVPSPPSPPPISPKTIPAETPQSASSTEAHKDDSPPPASLPHPHPHPPHTLHQASVPIPIALLPHYQLSLTDAAASSIPITDAYAPIDHWQWMATLWRGIVGPDITVVVKSAHTSLENHDGREGVMGSPKDGADAGGGGNGGGGKGSVELRLTDARTIVITGVGERELRRVGFEVGEWVRGMGEVNLGGGMGGQSHGHGQGVGRKES